MIAYLRCKIDKETPDILFGFVLQIVQELVFLSDIWLKRKRSPPDSPLYSLHVQQCLQTADNYSARVTTFVFTVNQSSLQL